MGFIPLVTDGPGIESFHDVVVRLESQAPGV
jgi:hypothetical protein